MKIYKFMKVIDEINFSIFMHIYECLAFTFPKNGGAIAVVRFTIIPPQKCPWIREGFRVVAKVFFLRPRRRKEKVSERNIMNLMNTYCFIELMNIMTWEARRTPRMVADSVMFAGICWGIEAAFDFPRGGESLYLSPGLLFGGSASSRIVFSMMRQWPAP
jgi:hypothetical protein